MGVTYRAIPPVFEDFGVLEDVCYQIHQEAEAADAEPRAPHGIPVLNELRRRLDAQWQAHHDLLSEPGPSLFLKTYMNATYAETQALLSEIGSNRRRLAVAVHRLEVLIHKVFVFSLHGKEDVERAIDSALQSSMPYIERGKELLSRLEAMREDAIEASTRYTAEAKEEWRSFDLNHVETASRPLNQSDRISAVRKAFNLPESASRTISRALFGK